MRKVFLLIAACCFFVACDSGSKKPEHFIEEAQMEDILYDVALLYGIQSSAIRSTDSVKQLDMNSIFKKYAIDSLIFVDNNRYYVGLDNNVYFNLQTRIVKRLEREQAAVDSILGKSNKEEELAPIKMEVLTDTVKATN